LSSSSVTTWQRSLIWMLAPMKQVCSPAFCMAHTGQRSCGSWHLHLPSQSRQFPLGAEEPFQENPHGLYESCCSHLL
jgi:hypothetical protein